MYCNQVAKTISMSPSYCKVYCRLYIRCHLELGIWDIGDTGVTEDTGDREREMVRRSCNITRVEQDDVPRGETETEAQEKYL